MIELELLSSHLNELVMRIRDCGEEFKTHLVLARDIEFDLAALVELEKIDDLDALLDMDSLEKNK